MSLLGKSKIGSLWGNKGIRSIETKLSRVHSKQLKKVNRVRKSILKASNRPMSTLNKIAISFTTLVVVCVLTLGIIPETRYYVFASSKLTSTGVKASAQYLQALADANSMLETLETLDKEQETLKQDIETAKIELAERLEQQRLEAEARAKAEADAKAKAEAEEQAKLKAQSTKSTTLQVTSKASKLGVGDERVFMASAYTSDCSGCSGTTKTGLDIRNSTPNVIAVDPKVIPLGSEVEIIVNDKSLGVYTAEDVGGAIKGNKIDILHETEKSANAWGKREVVVKRLD